RAWPTSSDNASTSGQRSSKFRGKPCKTGRSSPTSSAPAGRFRGAPYHGRTRWRSRRRFVTYRLGRSMRITVGAHGQIELPPVLLNNLRTVHRARLDPWLERLPVTLATVLDELDATIDPGDPGLSFSLVCFARRRTGERMVIKATVPNEELVA